MVHVTVRIPAWVYEQCKKEGSVSIGVRKALENYFQPKLTL